jgi:hypothetical protein
MLGKVLGNIFRTGLGNFGGFLGSVLGKVLGNMFGTGLCNFGGYFWDCVGKSFGEYVQDWFG